MQAASHPTFFLYLLPMGGYHLELWIHWLSQDDSMDHKLFMVALDDSGCLCQPAILYNIHEKPEANKIGRITHLH
jgi:hypothetical protein